MGFFPPETGRHLMHIPSYEIFVAIAYLVFLKSWYRNLSRDQSIRGPEFMKWLAVGLLAGIFALVGARGLQMLGTWSWADHGTALWGAIFGGYLAIYIGLFALFLGFDFTRLDQLQRAVDASVPGLLFAQGIGRMGCEAVGCCYGLHGYPVIKIEIAFGILGGLLFQTLGNSHRTFRRPLLCLYLYAYGVLRFVLEFYRGDPGRGSALGLTTSQWASLVALLISAIFLDFAGRTRDKTAL